MAGDWIKMRCDLATDPAVISIADAVGLDEDHVVGKLWKLWSWADQQTVDGNAPGVTEKWIDRYLNVTGFARAMVRVGWLTLNDDGMQIPRFDHHNGETGKARALTLKRVKAYRDRKCNADGVTGGAPIEKRREEKNKGEESPLTPSCSEPLFAASEPASLDGCRPTQTATTDVNPRSGRTAHAVQDRGGAKERPGPGCDTLDPAGDPAVLVFPVVGGKRGKGPAEWPLSSRKVDEYRESFPGIDVLAEARRALQWIRDNPVRRKTFRGMPSFLFRWMEKAQNQPGGQTRGLGSSSSRGLARLEQIHREQESQKNGGPY